MPTGIGLLFLVVGSYLAARRPHLLLGFLCFSAIFPATSAISFGQLWIMPYYVLAPLFIVSQFLRTQSIFKAKFPGKPFLIAFACVGLISALLFPLFFAGTPVYSPRLGTTDEDFTTFPLVFNMGNIAQAGYLILNVLVVLSAASAVKTDRVWTILNLVFYCLTGTIAAELVCLFIGVPFPYSIFENTPDRSSMLLKVIDPSQRLQGTCGEPSFTGLVLIIFFAAFFYQYYTEGRSGLKAIIAALALLLVRSSSALAAMGIVTLAIVLFNPPIRFPIFIDLKRLGRLIPLVVSIIVCVSSSAFVLLFREWVLDKPTSGSYLIRTTYDHYAINLLLRTYGVGVGLGSYRPSSLVASLAGNVGLVGTVVFALLMLQITISLPSRASWLRWALVGGLFDMALAIPDITQPILWCACAIVVYVSVPATSPAPHVRSPEVPPEPWTRGMLPSSAR